MDKITLFAAICVGFLVLSIIVRRLRKTKEAVETKHPAENLPYSLKKCVLTNREKKFYEVLKPVADKFNLTILIKIRLADFITCKAADKKVWQSSFNKINSKHIDFLLCDEQLKPGIAIELDDSTHDKEKRIERDKFVDAVYREIGLNIIHIRNYDEISLETQIKENL